MEKEQFISSLENELDMYIRKVDFESLDTPKIIDVSKRIALLSKTLENIRAADINSAAIEYLSLSPSPLKHIAEIWGDYDSLSIGTVEPGVDYFTVSETIDLIINDDLFSEYRQPSMEQAYGPASLPDTPAHKDAIEDIKRNITCNQESLTVAEAQKLLCAIGESLERSGGEQDQYYLFSHRMGGFAGFCGEPVGVSDIGGNQLFIGDMTALNGQPDKAQLVFRHSSGDPFPSQSYVNEARVVRVAGWQESMMFLRSKDFDVLSCRDDYRMSKQIASRMNTQIRAQGRAGR